MENFKVEVEETKTYWERMKNAFFRKFLTYTIMLLLVPLVAKYTQTNIPMQILIFVLLYYLFLLATSAFSCNLLCMYYITLLEIQENRVHIIYTKKGECFELNDSIENFSFKKGKSTRSNNFIPYLSIVYKKEDFYIKQYDKWNWEKEGTFEQAIDYFKKCGLLETTFLGW